MAVLALGAGPVITVAGVQGVGVASVVYVHLTSSVGCDSSVLTDLVAAERVCRFFRMGRWREEEARMGWRCNGG